MSSFLLLDIKMSIIKCHECGGQVSDEAKACPSCGAKPKKPVGRLGIIFAAIFGIAMFKACTPPDRPAPPQKTPEQIEREKLEDKKITDAVNFVKIIKQSTREPDSFLVENVSVNKDATIICVVYLGKNGFGGVSQEIVAMANGKLHREHAALKKHCTGNDLEDFTSVTKRNL